MDKELIKNILIWIAILTLCRGISFYLKGISDVNSDFLFGALAAVIGIRLTDK